MEFGRLKSIYYEIFIIISISCKENFHPLDSIHAICYHLSVVLHAQRKSE